MEEFLASLPEDGKKAAQDVEEFFNNFRRKVEVWNNVPLISSFSKEAAVYAYEHWMPREGDVFVATYPKTGTHWMIEVAMQVLFIRDPKLLKLMSTRGFSQMAIDSGPASKFIISDYFPCPRIMFTHLPEELVNYDKIKKNNAKVIYVYRNPKDQALSYYHFYKKIPHPEEMKHLKDYDWEKFLETYLAGDHHSAVPKGEWYPYHLKSWYKHKGDGNTLFVAFEDMKKDLPTEVRKVAKFLGVERTDEEIQEIARRCSFGMMQEKGKGTVFGSTLYRKGQVGEWKDHFTVAQSEMMDKILEKELEGIDITFKYEI